VNVTAAHDSVDDADETVTLTVTSGTGYSVGNPNSAEMDVIDVADLLPSAFDTSVTTSVNEDADVTVLDFASDLDGDTLTVIGVTQGDNGTVVLNMDGTVTYTPDTDFVGDDEFTYTVEDQFGNESTGTVSVTVTAPVAVPTSVWTDMDTPINIDAVELAFDPDEDELTVTAVTQGDNGTVAIETDGTVTYTPDTSFAGEDSFTYTVEDPDGNEATHTILVIVGESDPIALNNSATIAVNADLDVTIEDVAFDPSGDTVTAISVTQGAHGTVVINLDGTLTYTPDTDYEGTDEFTYTVEDSNSNTATGTISVRVGAAPPTEADEIESDLDDMLYEIENADENTPEALAAATPGITDALADLLVNVTTLISGASIATVYSNSTSPGGLVQGAAADYMKVYDTYLQLKALEAKFAAALEASAALTTLIAQQLQLAKLTPNVSPALLNTLQQAVQVLYTNHLALMRAYLPVYKAAEAAYVETLLLRTALKNAFPFGGPPAIQNLPIPLAPPDRGDFSQFVPKLP
jgi:hypothetical protein